MRMRFGVAAAFVLALLGLTALASADPLGSTALYKEGLRETAFIKNVTAGPDGNVWFVDNRLQSAGIPAIGRITSSGTVSEFVSGTNLSGLFEESDPIAITPAPKGEKYLWFTDRGATPAIGVIDSASPETAEEFSIQEKGGNAESMPQGIVAGPDGNLWFADAGATPAIGMINPSTHKVEEFFAGLNEGSQPRGIVAGPDGNLWFTDTGTTPAIGRINPNTQEIKEFSTGANSEPGGTSSFIGPWGIAAGPDGNVWFTESGTNTTNAPNGKAIGRITPAGEIKYFYENLLTKSAPVGLTSAGGKLWFTDDSPINEEQQIKISASEKLGGTYKLGFGGKETGWTGSGNISGFTATGNVKRAPASGSKNCTRTSGSKELKSCEAELLSNAEVGMRIVCSGVPVKTTITKIEGGVIFISNAATTSGTGGCNAGWIKNVTFSTSKATVGQQVAGTGVTTSEIIAVGELEGKGTITPASVPTAPGTSISLTGGSKTISSVTTSTGCVASGETVSGAGIAAGTTTTTTSCAPTSLTLSQFPTETATGVSLSADLPYNAEGFAIQGALEQLSTIGPENVIVSGTGEISPVERTILFESALQATDLEQVNCNGAGLSGPGSSCTVTTTQQGVPKAVGSITTSGEISRFPVGGLLRGVFGITNGPGGNVWLSTGFTEHQSIAKFGIEPIGPTNRRTLTLTKSPNGNEGKGLGSVSSKPKGIKCATTCNEAVGRFYENATVVLTEAPSGELSKFKEWTGACSGSGTTCTVSMTADKEVGAVFEGSSKPFSPAEALTLSKGESEQNFGWGTVKASGLTCEAECRETTVLYQGPITLPKFKAGKTVELKEAPAFGSAFVGWSGACSGTEPVCKVTMEEAKSVTAEFADLPDFALTVEKAYEGGLGSVSSKPKGISCGTTCTATSANMPEGSSILLTAKPATTEPPTTFVEWKGGDCAGLKTTTCTVGMDKAETVKAVFSGPVKTINSPKTLSLTKEGKGFGTVKASGLTCEVLCRSATSLYAGPVTLPKFKAGAKVILKATPAPGSTAVTWSGCKVLSATECEVVMETNTSVSAKFDELE
jgi:streptogramin lyase